MSADPNESGDFEDFFRSGERGAYADGPAKLKTELVQQPREVEDWAEPPLSAETRARQARLRRLVVAIVVPLGVASLVLFAGRLLRAPAESATLAPLGTSVAAARPALTGERPVRHEVPAVAALAVDVPPPPLDDEPSLEAARVDQDREAPASAVAPSMSPPKAAVPASAVPAAAHTPPAPRAYPRRPSAAKVATVTPRSIAPVAPSVAAPKRETSVPAEAAPPPRADVLPTATFPIEPK